MKKGSVIVLAALVAAMMVSAIGFGGCAQKTEVPGPSGPTTGMPDPSAAYCAKLGYKVEIRTSETGEQHGVCIFPDGTECDTWAFYRGKCGQNWTYCKQHGGTIENRTENMGTWTAEYAVCVFNDGSECSEQAYVEGKCGAGQCKQWKQSEGGCIKTK